MEAPPVRHTGDPADPATVPTPGVHNTDGAVEEGEAPAVARPGHIDGMREVFRVDAGQKVDLQALGSFLREGRVSTDRWDDDAMLQLGEELVHGESVLGLDYRGVAKRVVSVAKPVLYDGEHILVEAFQSFPSKKAKIKCSGMSEKFSATRESSEEACKRALVEELKMDAGSVFFGPTQLVKVDAFSQKFAGLESEYHLYYMLVEPHVCTTVQQQIPKAAMTPISELDSHTNPKTLWFAWCPRGEATEIESFLAELAGQGPATEAGGSSIDWHEPLKLGSPGQQVLDELQCALRLAEDAAYKAEFQRYQQGLTDLTALSSFVQGKAYANERNSDTSTDGSESFW